MYLEVSNNICSMIDMLKTKLLIVMLVASPLLWNDEATSHPEGGNHTTVPVMTSVNTTASTEPSKYAELMLWSVVTTLLSTVVGYVGTVLTLFVRLFLIREEVYEIPTDVAKITRMIQKQGRTCGRRFGTRREELVDGLHLMLHPLSLVKRTTVSTGGYRSVVSHVFHVWLFRWQKLFLKLDLSTRTIAYKVVAARNSWDTECIPTTKSLPPIQMSDEQWECLKMSFEFYRKHGWVRIFISGPPGCGKTMMSRYLATRSPENPKNLSNSFAGMTNFKPAPNLSMSLKDTTSLDNPIVYVWNEIGETFRNHLQTSGSGDDKKDKFDNDSWNDYYDDFFDEKPGTIVVMTSNETKEEIIAKNPSLESRFRKKRVDLFFKFDNLF